MSVLQNLDNLGILTLTLNRPEKLNALNSEALGELETIFLNAKLDPNIKGIIITGNGKAFCAGADINRLAECNAVSGYEFAESGQRIFRLLETIGKPSIAAINGYAFGGGCELLLSTTIRIASTNASFSQPEIKLGVIPGYGGTQRLARYIGKGRAMEMCLTGKIIKAETAENWGLVTEVVEPDTLLAIAHERLTQLLSLAPIAIQSIMDVINLGYDMSLDESLHLEAVHFAKICSTQDKTEGVSAFLEKRKPTFIGA